MYYYSYSTNSNYSSFAEKDGIYSLFLGVPGFVKEDIEVSIEEPDYVMIKGASKEFGEFETTKILPEDIDIETVKASVKNGVLEITAQKSKVQKGRKIRIT